MDKIISVEDYLADNLGIVNQQLLSALKDAAVVKNVKKGERIIKNGEGITGIPFLLYGVVKHVVITEDGEEMVRNICCERIASMLPAGFDLFGTYISNEEVVAKSNCIVMVIDAGEFRKILSQHKDGTALLSKIHSEVSRTNFEYLEILKKYHNNVKGLYLHYLQFKPVVVANSTLEELASFMGVSMYQISRVRSQLKNEYIELFENLKSCRL